MEQSLRIYAFNSLVIKQDGQVVEDFLTQKTALLLLYLVMNPGEHSRDQLAPLFWSNTTNEQALKNLRTIVSDLRKTVPDFVTIDGRILQAHPSIWLDVQNFSKGCAAVFTNQPLSLEQMLAISDLYTGAFLDDSRIRNAEDLEDWVSQQREILQKKYTNLLYHITAYCLEHAEFHTGMDIARRLVTLNPMSEAAQRQLMHLLVAMGESNEALVQYERLVTLLKTELDTEPEPETVRLYEQIKKGEIVQRVKEVGKRIILPDFPYIVPAQALDHLRQMFDTRDCRLMTLTGMGGTGKTMLATYFAHERQTLYHDEVIIVPLVALTDSNELAKAILTGLDENVQTANTDEQLIKILKERRLLLVLDNYEQLLPDTQLIEKILETALNAQILVTSQRALNLRQERLFVLTGLQNTHDDNPEALRLFHKTVERIAPNLDLEPYRDDILAICDVLEGLPLGIVIAAGQMKYHAPSDILKILGSNLSMMRATFQDLPERHRSFANLVDSTIRNLSPDEQTALQSLSIFRGSFTYEAALAVADIDSSTFISLTDKSMLQRVENFRYTIHGLLRGILVKVVDQSPDKDAIRQRLTEYYQVWCHNLYARHGDAEDNLLMIDAEHTNIWHLDLLTENEQERYILEIFPALEKYWRHRGFTDTAFEIIERAIHNPIHPTTLRAQAMVRLAWTQVILGRHEQAAELCEEAIAFAPHDLYVRVQRLQTLGRLAMQRGDYETAWSYLIQVADLEGQQAKSDDPNIELMFIGNHTGLGLIAMTLDEVDLARSHFEIAMNSWQKKNQTIQAAHAHNNLGLLDLRAGLYDSAKRHFSEAIAVLRATKNDATLMSVLGNLGKAHMLCADYKLAHELLVQSSQLAIQLKHRKSLLLQLETFTHLAYLLEEYTIATQLYGYIQKTSEEQQVALAPKTIEQVKHYTAVMADVLDHRFEFLVNLGRKMSQDTAVALAHSLDLVIG